MFRPNVALGADTAKAYVACLFTSHFPLTITLVLQSL